MAKETDKTTPPAGTPGEGNGEAAAAKDESGLIWVCSGRSDDRVAFTEKHDKHPQGEAFVATKTPTQVFETGKVTAALAAGVIVKTDAPKPKE